MTMNFDPTGGPLAPPNDAEIERRYSNNKPKKGKTLKTLALVIFVLAFVVIIVFGIIALVTKKDAPIKDEVSTSPSTSVATVSKSDVPDFTESKTYQNGPMGLTFSYPDTWKVTETTDKGIRIESAAFTYTSQDKGDVLGLFRIYIRKGSRLNDGKIIGRGVAIQPSEKLVYTQPAPDQRKDTLLTLFGLDDKDNFGFFLIAGNFQLNVGDTLGPNYGKEPDAFIVGGGFSGADLVDDLSTHTVDISTIPTSKAYTQALDILKSLQLH